MLMLSRKTGESIVINDDIMITVVEVGRGRVQIGVRAPSYVPVYREEIVRRMVATGEIEPLECLEAPTAVAVG
jgi:carbon storage regulator